MHVMQRSSDTQAESHALDFMKKLKEDGVVKAYGGAQQVFVIDKQAKQTYKPFLNASLSHMYKLTCHFTSTSYLMRL